MMNETSKETSKEDRIDLIFRNLMLACGAISALSFIASLFSFIQFPSASTTLIILMLGSALLFFVIRVIYRFRVQYKLKEKEKATPR